MRAQITLLKAPNFLDEAEKADITAGQTSEAIQYHFHDRGGIRLNSQLFKKNRQVCWISLEQDKINIHLN